MIKILIVEDNKSQSEMIASILDKNKYEIFFAYTGNQALEILLTDAPFINLVLVDYHLPDFNGIEIIEKVKQTNNFYSFIFVTADKNIDTVVKVMRAGACHFVQKNNDITKDLPLVVERVYENYLLKKKQFEIDTQLQILSAGVEQSGSVIVVTDLEGKIEYVNKRFTEVTGYSLTEAKGQNPRILKSGDKPNEYYQDLWNKITKGQTWKGEFINKRKDGELFYEEAIISPIKNKNGEIIKYMAVKDDITIRKQTEQLLIKANDIINRSPIVAFRWRNSEGWHVEYVSSNVEKLSGYSSSEFLNNDIIYTKLIHKNDIERVVEEVKYYSEIKEYPSFTHKPYRIICKNGKTKWIEDISYKIRNTENVITHYEGIISDITERIEAELIIKKQNDELKKLNDDKDRFIRILAHDLKNPFNSLLGFSELLLKNLRKYDIEKIEKQLNVIYTASKQTYNLLEDLLLWSKSQSNKLSFEPQTYFFSEICNELISNFKINSKNITINCLETERTKIKADLNMLKTVMRNLVSNAIKFTNQNGSINIYSEKSDENIIITVSDNGIGIPEENITNLWDYSQLITTSGTEGERGTGIGLPLCKEFVEKHGGKIWVESEVGKGSDFKFTMPLCND